MALRRARRGLGVFALIAMLSLTACTSAADEPDAAPEQSTAPSSPSTSAEPSPEATSEPTSEPSPPGPHRTSCKAVTHVGDSTSEGLDSSAYLPREVQRLPAQLRQVGAQQVFLDIRGARSIVERWHGEPNAQEAVQARKAAGFDGCWSIAMGINEAANRAAGSAYDARDRIDLIMNEVGDDPVMWLTVKTLVRDGYYADEGMQQVNRALLKACHRYPNLRVYDWRVEVRREWYIPDGIHFTSEGYRQRSRRIAQALARAFTRDAGPSPDCVVTVTER